MLCIWTFCSSLLLASQTFALHRTLLLRIVILDFKSETLAYSIGYFRLVSETFALHRKHLLCNKTFALHRKLLLCTEHFYFVSETKLCMCIYVFKFCIFFLSTFLSFRCQTNVILNVSSWLLFKTFQTCFLLPPTQLRHLNTLTMVMKQYRTVYLIRGLLKGVVDNWKINIIILSGSCHY